jgi:hypothetical protein
MLRKIALFTAVTAFSVSSVYAGVDEAKKWIDEDFNTVKRRADEGNGMVH